MDEHKTTAQLEEENNLLKAKVNELEQYALKQAADFEKNISILSQKMEEATLHAQGDKKQLQAITENIPGVVYQFYANNNGEAGVHYVSPKLSEIFGIEFIEDGSLFFQKFSENIHDEDKQIWFESIAHVVEKQIPWRWKGRYVKEDGEIVWFEGHSIPTVRENEIVFNGYFIDITDKIEQERELKLAKEAAESANQAKSEFLANMSHELRTPLNAIIGFAQVMERNKKDPSDEVAIRTIKSSGEHLLTLINEILDFSKIEAGQIEVEETSFDLLSLLNELKGMLLLEATQKGILLTFDIKSEVPRHIRIDEIKLRQVLLNLLNNAIKFTDEGIVRLRVLLSGKSDNGRLVQPNYVQSLKFEIQDTGRGISSSDTKKLFQPFSQVSCDQKLQEGTGLGLVISKSFIELLGGEISYRSELEKGTTFSFTVPVHILDEKNIRHPMSITRVIGLKPNQPSFRILVVDDHGDNRQLMLMLLKPVGFDLREAVNGKEAIDLVEKWVPDLILMDLRMPVLDGIEATKKIRSCQSLKKQPVIIAVTANILQQDIEKLSGKGFDDILIKPFAENNLFDQIKKHLSVDYIYDSGEIANGQVQRDYAPDSLLVSSDDFKTLPEDIFNELEKTISSLKIDRTLKIIKEIRDYNELLADKLQQLVKEYRFDILQKLTAGYIKQNSQK